MFIRDKYECAGCCGPCVGCAYLPSADTYQRVSRPKLLRFLGSGENTLPYLPDCGVPGARDGLHERDKAGGRDHLVRQVRQRARTGVEIQGICSCRTIMFRALCLDKQGSGRCHTVAIMFVRLPLFLASIGMILFFPCDIADAWADTQFRRPVFLPVVCSLAYNCAVSRHRQKHGSFYHTGSACVRFPMYQALCSPNPHPPSYCRWRWVFSFVLGQGGAGGQL